MINYPIIPIDPGPLIDDDLRLVAPGPELVEPLMEALQHPSTRFDMPTVSQTSREQVAGFLSRLTNGFDPGEWDSALVPAYHFWMTHTHPRAGMPRVVGGLNLRIGSGLNIERVIGHIGYHVYPFARGQRYAERACRLLLPIARHHGVDPLCITCNPDNAASRRTIERLGGELMEIAPVPADHPIRERGETEKCVYFVRTED